MAIFLVFDKRHFGPNGFIPLKRSDRWLLSGKVVEKYARYEKELDLTGVSGATGFFEAADLEDVDALVPFSLDVIDAKGGQVQLDIPASASSSVALAENGISAYATIDHPDLGLITVETEQPVLEIRDRGFAEA